MNGGHEEMLHCDWLVVKTEVGLDICENILQDNQDGNISHYAWPELFHQHSSLARIGF